MPASGDPTVIAGGPWRISIYGIQPDPNACPYAVSQSFIASNGEAFDRFCGVAAYPAYNILSKLTTSSFLQCQSSCADQNTRVGHVKRNWISGALAAAARRSQALAYGRCNGVTWDPNTNLCSLIWLVQGNLGSGSIQAATIEGAASRKRDNTDASSDGGLFILGGGDLQASDDTSNFDVPDPVPDPPIDYAANPDAYPGYQYNGIPDVTIGVLVDGPPLGSNSSDLGSDSDDSNSGSSSGGGIDFGAALAAIDSTVNALPPNVTSPEPTGSGSNDNISASGSATNSASSSTASSTSGNTSSGDVPAGSSYVSISSLDRTLQITVAGNGNLFMAPALANPQSDVTFLFPVGPSGGISTSYTGALLHFYSDTMASLGVSRLRFALSSDRIPLTAQAM